MITTQTWSAPLFPPTPAVLRRDEHGAPILIDGRPVELTPAVPGNKTAEITLFDHPVRHRKDGQPDAHARVVAEQSGKRIREIYLNRSYTVLAIAGALKQHPPAAPSANVRARATFKDSTGRVLAQRVLHEPGAFELLAADAEPTRLAIGFTVTLEQLGADYIDGHIAVTFRQDETEVSRVQ